MRRVLGALLAGAAAYGALILAAPPAGAHALLLISSPAHGVSVAEAPAQMLFVFTEAIDPRLSVVHVVDSSGTEVDVGRAERVSGQPAHLRVRPGSLPRGAYTATWRVTSPADGHSTVGAVAFGVGVPAPAAAGEAGAGVSGTAPSLVSTTGRWLFYVGSVLLMGAAVVGVWVVSKPAAVPRRALAAAWAAAAGGVLVKILDQRASAQTSLARLLSSPTGHRLTAQAVAVAAAGLTVACACRRPTRGSLATVGVATSAAMLARALAGHANASSPRWFTVGTQWVHILAAGAWVGGLAWLLIAVRKGDPGRGRGLVRRFSSVAAWTLAVVALSGGIRALDQVGAWGHLLSTDFGRTLLVKVGLVAALVALGATARYRHLRAAAAGDSAACAASRARKWRLPRACSGRPRCSQVSLPRASSRPRPNPPVRRA